MRARSRRRPTVAALPFKTLTLFLISLTVTSATLRAEASDEGTGNHATKPNVYINRGADLEVCKALIHLFDVPENAHYLWTRPEITTKGLKAATEEGYDNRQLHIPHTAAFQNFSEPNWKDVDDAVARRILPTLIDHQDRYQNHLVLGEDYKIQKTEFDLDGDGKNDTIYRSIGKGYMPLLMDETATDPLAHAVNTRQLRGHWEHAQLVYYKSWPFVLVRSGVFGLSAYRFSFGELDKRLSLLGTGSRCQFNATRKMKLD